MKTTAKQTERCGELLCQFRLLQHGISSEPGKRGSLIAQSNANSDSYTIQVRTCGNAKPGGGKGRIAIDWWIQEDSTEDYIALVDVYGVRVWLFTLEQLSELAQQNPEGRLHFFMYYDPEAPTRKDGKLQHEYDFHRYLIENAIHRLDISKKPNKTAHPTAGNVPI